MTDICAGGKGTGLGLALVRQIVKLSGGRLGVQSKVGEGSTFWVELRKRSLRTPRRYRSDGRSVALGVGTKAIPALNSPLDIEEDEYPSPRQAVSVSWRHSLDSACIHFGIFITAYQHTQYKRYYPYI